MATLVVLAACAGTPEPTAEARGAAPVRGVDFAAETAVLESFPVQLAGRVRITNLRDEPVRLSFPDRCVAMLRIYPADGGRTVPVWDQRRAVDCEPAETTVDLPPGEVTDVPAPTVGAGEILGDSLPAGTYRVTAYLRPGGRVVEIDAGTVELRH